MVSLVNARETIYQAFETAWGSLSPYTFDNEDFTPPENAPWVRVAVRHDGSTLECIGGSQAGGFNTFQRTGRAVVQVFGRLNKGTREADTLAQAARAIFEGTTLANAIRLTNAVIREIGPDGAWYQINVEAFFQYDERK